MKKILFMLSAGLLFAASVSAQSYYGPRRYSRRHPRVIGHEPVRERRPVDDFYRPTVGLAGGLNVSNTVDAYNSNFSTSSIAGFHAGLVFSIPIAYPLSFAPEVLFSQKGYKAETTYGQFTQRTNYIDVPLLLKFQVVRGFNFVVGPQLSFLTATKNTYDNGFNTVYQESYNNRGDKSIVSGVLGLSIDLNRNVELRGRYNIDLGKNYADGSSNIPDYRNQVFQVGLGFKFN